MFQIKQSEATAARRRIPLLFVSSTDGFTPVTPTSPVAYISQNGATWVATTNAPAVATLAGGQSLAGVYYLELTATEVANLGWITVNVQASNARQYNAQIQVMAYDPYDIVRIGLTSIPNVAQGNNGALPTGSATGQVTVATNNDKTGYSLTQTFPTNFSSLAITAGGAVTAGTVSDKTGYSLSGTQSFNLTGNITGNLSGSVGSVTGAVGSVTGNVGGNVTGSVGSLTATAVQNIWDDTTSSLTTVGSIGKLLVDNVNATISSRATDSGVWAVGTRTLTSGTNIVLAKGTGITGFNDISVNNIWSETLPGSYTSTQAGFKLNAAGSSADPWSTTLPGAYSLGTAGYIIGNNLNSPVGSVATNVWSVGTRTLTAGTNIVLAKGTGITGFNDITALSVWDVLASTVSVTGSMGLQLKTNVDATVSSRLATAGYTAPPSASTITTSVWSELTSNYDAGAFNGSFGKNILRDAQDSKVGDVTTHQSGGTSRIDADVHAIANDTAAATSFKNILTGISGETLTANLSGNVTGYVETVHDPANIATAVWQRDINTGFVSPDAGWKLWSLTGGGGGGGTSTEIRSGVFQLRSEQDTVDGVVETLVGASVPLQIQVVDGTGTPIPVTGTVNIKTYNSAGTLVETLAGTIDYGALGYVSATITSTTTIGAGRYSVVAEVTDTTTVKYGGLQLLVKGL